MAENFTLIESLAELGGAELLFRRGDEAAMVAAAVAQLPGGRTLLAVERTYREGIRIIVDPAPEEIETARSGELWNLWNSTRSKLLYGAV